MDPNAYGDDFDTDQPGTYWRRRFATMVAGLAALGLLVWAFSSGGGPSAGPAPLSSPSSGALSNAAYPGASASSTASQASSRASAGAAAAGPGLAPSNRSAKAGAEAGAEAGANGRSATSAPNATSVPGATSASDTESGGRCAPSAVVLSVTSSGRSFPAGQNPAFAVDAVSTAPGTCTFDLSPAQLHLVVMSAGRVIWDSADCGHGGANRLRRLTRGVPVQQSFTWNRTITLPGCVTLASSARPGSYSAQAKTAAVDSNVYNFKLVHP